MIHTMTRREYISFTGAAVAGLLTARQCPGAEAAPGVGVTSSMPRANPKFQPAYDALADQMRRLYEICRVKVDGRELLRPCASTHYNGLWHDDFTWPHIGLPELQKTPVLRDSIAWLTEAMVDLPVVADRIEFDGTAVMSPGTWYSRPMSEEMTLHLPAAWTRLLSHATEAGIEIPRRRDWARLIERSFARVYFSFGLVWNDPQRNTVAFGFYDSIKQTGLVLTTSLVIKRGLERAAALFENDLPAETIADWKSKAKGIGENLHRLFDAEIGGFVGSTKVGRGFDVWGNGLAWPLATPEQRKVIAATFAKHRADIFALGCTRQNPYPDGWPGTTSKGYQNRGFWATGTGFVLPALAEADPDFALQLAQDLVDNIEKIKRHEFIDATGKPGGPADFLGSLSMPLMGLRAILTGRPLLDFM